MKLAILNILISFTLTCLGQNNNFENWTKSEKIQYYKLSKLARYINEKTKHQISKDSLFSEYIFFDYVLNDTNTVRREKRLAVFDTIFYTFRKIVDSLGMENFDAKPIRFFKDHPIYEPFDEKIAKKSITGKRMYTKNTNIFAYFIKNEPKKPLGALAFEPETNKLLSWIMIDQGGYKYFLTFNLL